MLLADYRRQIDGVLVARDATRPSSEITADSAVFPARNEESPGGIQVTANAARRTAEEIPSHEEESSAAEMDGDSSIASTPENVVVASEQSVPEDETVAQVVTGNGDQVPEAAPVEAVSTMEPQSDQFLPPPAAEITSQPVQTELSVEAPASSPSAVTDLPALPRSRTVWVLKFDPPPKFRQ